MVTTKKLFLFTLFVVNVFHLSSMEMSPELEQYLQNRDPISTALNDKRPDNFIEELIERNAPVNVDDPQNGVTTWQPLHRAVKGNRRAIVLKLIGQHAIINAQTKVLNRPECGNDTPLHFAVGDDNYDMCVLLLSCGAPKDQPNARKITPRQLAQQKNNGKIIALFEQEQKLDHIEFLHT